MVMNHVSDRPGMIGPPSRGIPRYSQVAGPIDTPKRIAGFKSQFTIHVDIGFVRHFVDGRSPKGMYKLLPKRLG